jgi:peptidase S41-like protein
MYAASVGRAATYRADCMMRATSALLVLALSACGDAFHGASQTSILLQESFSAPTFKNEWVAEIPNVTGATVRLENGAMILTMPADGSGEITMRRKLDVSAMRGKRIRVKARLRTEGSTASFARATLTFTTRSLLPSYRDTVSTESVSSGSWRDVQAVIDVSPESLVGQIVIAFRGPGTAWFDDVEIATIGSIPPANTIELSPQQLTNLAVFARAAALIRYVHPSDQAASLDWNAFFPVAIQRVLLASPQDDLASLLTAMFSEIAPSAIFASTGSSVAPSIPPRGKGLHLVRWRRHGFGASPPFSAYREGRDPDNASATASTRLNLDRSKTCKKISVKFTGKRLPGPGKALSFVRILLPAVKRQDNTEPLRETPGDVILEAEMPKNTWDVEVGLRVEGLSGAAVDRISSSCDGSPYEAVDLVNRQWAYTDSTELYKWSISTCDGNPCAMLERVVDDTFDVERDILNRDIGNGIAIRLPLAVSSNDQGTLPPSSGRQPLNGFAINDVPTRLAAIAAAWGMLSIFYPYFADQHIDWSAALPEALREAAAARSPRETHVALAHLVAHLRDNHGKVSHPAASTAGTLPLTFRRFGDKLIVNGGLPEYLKEIPVGSELVEIDGMPAIRSYDHVATQVSAATEGLREYMTPLRMGMGSLGAFMPLRIRDFDGRVTDHVLPLVSDDLYAPMNREPRPTNGTELIPGVYYFDVGTLQATAWEKLLPIVEHARSIILDFRGYVNGTTIDVMSHLTDTELRSPIWQTPIVPNVDGHKYSTGYWWIRSQPPRLTAKMVALVDARAMSSAETILQIFRENNLGVLVGETTGGTNGNVATAEVPGGFDVRFTAMRASGQDGSTVQGHGFGPDYVIHPSLEGIRAGRDEILEAGIATAKQLIGL